MVILLRFASFAGAMVSKLSFRSIMMGLERVLKLFIVGDITYELVRNDVPANLGRIVGSGTAVIADVSDEVKKAAAEMKKEQGQFGETLLFIGIGIAAILLIGRK